MEARKLTGGDLDVFIENEVPRTQSWLYDTLMGFVNDECDVFVATETDDTGATFTVRVAPGDMGKVIGKNGQMARNLRSMLLARARKLGVVYTLNIEQERAIDRSILASPDEDESDPNANLIVRIELTHGEAGAVYAAMMTIQEIAKRGHDPRLDAAIEKLKQAQLAAIVESVRAEEATGKVQ